jgi:hypothetical protein
MQPLYPYALGLFIALALARSLSLSLFYQGHTHTPPHTRSLEDQFPTWCVAGVVVVNAVLGKQSERCRRAG